MSEYCHCCHHRYQLITPLHSSQWEKPVLVNRGWVPVTWRSDPKFRQQWESKDDGTTLQAVTRASEDPSVFVPHNNPKTGEWFWIDVPAMAASLDLPSDTPLVEVSIQLQSWKSPILFRFLGTKLAMTFAKLDLSSSQCALRLLRHGSHCISFESVLFLLMLFCNKVLNNVLNSTITIIPSS